MKNNVISNNILHIARKRLVNSGDITRAMIYGHGPRIGALPYDMLAGVDKSERASTTKNVDSVFANFAQKISYLCPANGYALDWHTFQDSCDWLKHELVRVLSRYDIDVQYFDSGTFKHCTRLDIGTYSYALLTFIDLSPDKLARFYDSDGNIQHGADVEPQNYFTMYYRLPHGRAARPFIARVGNNDDAYVLTKFIDDRHTNKKTRGLFSSRRDFIESHDIRGWRNTSRGIIVDAGGFQNNSLYITNQRLRNTWYEFAQILDAINLSSVKTGLLFSRLHKKYHRGVDILNCKNWPRLIWSLPPDDKSETLHILRKLRKLYDKKQSLESSGQYNAVQELLKQDFVAIFNFFRFYDSDFATDDKYYPRLIAELLGISNVPPLSDLMKIISMRGNKRVEFHSTKNKDIKLTDFYSESEIITEMKRHPDFDWSVVIKKQGWEQRLNGAKYVVR